MEGIILPESVFGREKKHKKIGDNDDQKPIKKSNKKIIGRKTSTLKKPVTDTDSESEIDVEDTYQVASDSEDESEKKKNNVVTEDEYSNTHESPVYDGVEPYFIFQRRWEAFCQSKQSKHIHELMLDFLNKLFCTNYKSLRSIKKITTDMIPTPKKFTDMMMSDRDYIETFKIRYSQNIPTIKMLNNLLAKVSYSMVEVDKGKKLHYVIKPRSVSARSGM